MNFHRWFEPNYLKNRTEEFQWRVIDGSILLNGPERSPSSDLLNPANKHIEPTLVLMTSDIFFLLWSSHDTFGTAFISQKWKSFYSRLFLSFFLQFLFAYVVTWNRVETHWNKHKSYNVKKNFLKWTCWLNYDSSNTL